MDDKEEKNLKYFKDKMDELKEKYSKEYTTYTSSSSSNTGDPYWGINPYPYPNHPTQPYTYPSTSDGTYWNGSGPSDIDTLRMQEILERLDAIEKRLKIMEDADPELVEALKDAYDHYKFIEKLCEDSAKERAEKE